MDKLFANQKVLLIGLGESGLACARWILMQGGELTVLDSREKPPGLQELEGSVGQSTVGFRLVKELPANLEPDRIIASPGLPPHHPLVRACQNLADTRGIQIESELDLFDEAIRCLGETRSYSPKVLAITGTNGKTTTCRMTALLCEYAGHTAQAAGNISPAAMDALMSALEDDRLPEVWVLELSSFQLHWTRELRIDASVVLNLSEDHLDWHASQAEYAADKAKIYRFSQCAVLAKDDATVMLMRSEGQRTLRFGQSTPTVAGDFGLVRDGGIIWMACLDEIEASSSRKGRKPDPSEDEPSVRLLMPVDALQVAGLHNAANALAALALTRAIGLPMAGLLHGLRSYKGEPHRVEFVQNLDGVDYYDDSKGTNVGATVAALEGLARPCVLIAGGQGKGQNFAPLKLPVRRFCKSVLVYGQDADLLAQALDGQCMVRKVSSLQAAVVEAASLAQPGDCVLLSPACASLDMFRNYVHRAEVFVQAVQEIAMQRGQVC